MIVPEADLVTVKTLASGDSTPAEGDTVTFEIEVVNNGSAEATNVSLTDVLPAGLTATGNNGTATSGTYDAGTGLWTLGTLANGDSATLTLEGTVDAGQGGNTITNITTAAGGDQLDPSTGGDDLDESVVIDDAADLVTVKTLASGDSTPAEGDTVTFEIEVVNNGSAEATNVSLTDVLPAGLTATENNGGVTVGTYDAGTGLWTLGTLANGDSAVLTVEGIVDVGQGGVTISNITSAATGDQVDPTTAGDDLVENVTVDVPVCSLSGVVFLDDNSNGQQDTGETVLANWIVQIKDSRGTVIAEVITDENGNYQADLPCAGNLEVDFINPDTGTVYSTTSIDLDASTKLPNGTVEIVVNFPIDPSGVVYDSVTRQPVPGTVLTLVDSNNQPLPPVCFIDPSQQNQTTDSDGRYRFDIVPGAASVCPIGQTDYSLTFDAPESHLDTNSTIIGAQPGFLTTTAGTGPLEVVSFVDAPQVGEDTTHYFGFTLGQGSRDVINNHIPLDPIGLVRSPLSVMKSTPRTDVNFGDLVPYTITATNTEDLPRIDLDIIDFIPPGFKFVEDSSLLDGVEIAPEVSGREIILNDFDFAANETKTWTMLLVVGASVGEGVHTNQAFIRDSAGEDVSNRAEAAVRLAPDPLFDCSEVIGKVFDDKDKDGFQDEGEPGLAGVRLATAKGLLVTTDHHGRYHIACAAIPNAHIGSNFILKLDKRTLPTGYQLTSENPRVVRLTRGKLSKANFGTALENIITLDVTDAAFVGNTNTLRPEFAQQMGQIIEALKGQESTLKLTYFASANGREERIYELSAQIQNLWDVYGDDYDLNIDRKTIWPGENYNSQTVGGE